MLNRKEFGIKTKGFRNKRGLTQEVLAEKADISYSYLLHLESGDNTPSVDVLVDLLNALNINYSELTDDSVYSDNLTSSILHKYELLDLQEKRFFSIMLEKIQLFGG